MEAARLTERSVVFDLNKLLQEIQGRTQVRVEPHSVVVAWRCVEDKARCAAFSNSVCAEGGQ
jgi:hypothetical protein